MPQSLPRVLIHTVFSTKDRAPFLANQELRQEAHSYLGGIAKKLDCHPIQVGGTADHVHLLTTLPRTTPIADLIKETKRVSSNWIKERGGIHAKFHWQSGYGVFSVSPGDADRLSQYIGYQERHHHKTGYQEEYRSLLEEHEIEFDERYVWD